MEISACSICSQSPLPLQFEREHREKTHREERESVNAKAINTSTTTRMDENECILNSSKEVHKGSVKEGLNALKTSPKLHLMESNIHTRVFEAKLQDGAVWEKAGVSVSVVYGVMPPEAYRAARPTDNEDVVKPGPVPFFAAGAPMQWWFGGGTDLTPAYIFEEDVKHFHSVQKNCL
ncbi:Oxygen-dependent coproporphyrinogen-III oxidase, chloroplastic [Capsicum chinense]|nr:Oxygen-dependent coproporphyrinogen-III oxidase, chloroplastic [Capsicum chinense]